MALVFWVQAINKITATTDGNKRVIFIVMVPLYFLMQNTNQDIWIWRFSFGEQRFPLIHSVVRSRTRWRALSPSHELSVNAFTLAPRLCIWTLHGGCWGVSRKIKKCTSRQHKATCCSERYNTRGTLHSSSWCCCEYNTFQ
jgi:hypothetical protein